MQNPFAMPPYMPMPGMPMPPYPIPPMGMPPMPGMVPPPSLPMSSSMVFAEAPVATLVPPAFFSCYEFVVSTLQDDAAEDDVDPSMKPVEL
jgi:hypothetical protein